MENLKNKNLIKYRPVSGRKEKLDIRIRFSVVAVLDVDEVKQTFSFMGSFMIDWYDADIKWNASEFGNINSIEVDQKLVWKPNIMLANSVDRIYFFDGHYDITIHHTGNINALKTDIFHTTCPIDIFKYPFDSQRCGVQIVEYNNKILSFHASTVNLDFPEIFSVKNEWYFDTEHGLEAQVRNISMGFSNSITMHFQVVDFTMTIKRKSLFYIVTTLFPMFLLSLLTCSVFLIPALSGDRMCYLISIFVSYSMFLNFINDSMPRTSQTLSLFEMYLVFVLCHCCSAIFVTLLVLRVNNRTSKSLRQIDEQSMLLMLNTILKQDVSKSNDDSSVDPIRKRKRTSAIRISTQFSVLFS
ncbi:acetylcholine receptor subunit delta-like [Gigantopelta aegis]|uniref:acetylcholine receptor subunit delta-like n=1 Tax=Gigantopelta aegis TaxID=1735272 RepID=UPI001B88ABDC|nr:acetylcholine receptor subunit delta-like [Gigantopelta aegis]